MAARRDRGKANYRLIENLKGERDEELQALRRQIEKLALQIEHHEALMRHRASKRGYSHHEDNLKLCTLQRCKSHLWNIGTPIFHNWLQGHRRIKF
ncbi:hypothetical protein Pyn_16922 [Prunus yedoensis var. nudiflora]|uniref:Uncharacterized protein n=1 Tax=Prunus yedoensis var. nudiflora TaxID=2094558 RepID=A0A314ZSU7_PRUYE|nr:hypothetical protein Pyn_16922 [Prunus yedoensis var. nudiflora]